MTDRETRIAVRTAGVAAAAMIASQVAGKATRDALFLSSFDVAQLPTMVIVSAIVSLFLALASARALATRGPARLVPWAFWCSAAALGVEWALLGRFRQAVAVVLFVHMSALTALLISGFWSLVNERFDPRTARRQIGRILLGGTLGGLFGGLVSERVAALSSVAWMLPFLAVMHVACGAFASRLAPVRSGEAHVADFSSRDGLRYLAETPYLRNLVWLVLLVAASEQLVDYVFKAQAVEALQQGERLLRLFAAFHAVTSLVTVLVQTSMARFLLERLGLAQTAATLPAGIVAGGFGVLLAPGLASSALLLGGATVLRNSLYRSAYELFFTPLAPRVKRATKSLVDVAVVRLGDIVGAQIVQIALLVAASRATSALVVLALLLATVTLIVSRLLHSGYVHALESSLLSRAVHLDAADARDMTTRTAILRTLQGLDLRQIEELAQAVGDRVATAPPAPDTPTPEEARRLALQSGDAERVRAELRVPPRTRTEVLETLPLLAWDEVAEAALAALRPVVDVHTDDIVARFVDPETEFAVRRRIPLLLAGCTTQAAVDGLVRGLEDARFEVRYRSGRVLARLLELRPRLVVGPESIRAAILREVDVQRGVWESRRLLDTQADEAETDLDQLVRQRANRSLEHVFNLLSFVLPRAAVRAAFRGLHAPDAHLRGTALEYLESTLPEPIRVKLWPFLEEETAAAPGEGSATALEKLLESQASIRMSLEELRRRTSQADPDQKD